MGAHHHHPHRRPPAHGFLHRLSAGFETGRRAGVDFDRRLLPRAQLAGFAGRRGVLWTLIFGSRISGWFLLKRMLLLEPLVLGVAGLMLFQPDGGMLFALAMLKANLVSAHDDFCSRTPRRPPNCCACCNGCACRGCSSPR